MISWKIRIAVLSETLSTIQFFDQVWYNSTRESSETKWKCVLCYLAIIEKNADVDVLADLKEFLIRRSMINREVWSIRLFDWCSEARKFRSCQTWTITSREINEIIRLLSNILIIRVTIDELIDNGNWEQKTDVDKLMLL